MFDKLTSVSGSQTALHLEDEPLVIVHETLDRFFDKRSSLAALVGGETGEFCLQVGTKMYFHLLPG